MPTAKILLLAGAASAVFAAAAVAQTAPSPSPAPQAAAARAPAAPDPAYLDYAVLDDAATLPDGRRIQMVCMGQGSPTVILTAGMGQWGATWRPVQKPIAEHTRVCTWDRPGYGFSDASPVAQTTAATTDDLEAALLALCAWADEGSSGLVVWYFTTLSKAQDEFVEIRGQIEKKSN